MISRLADDMYSWDDDQDAADWEAAVTMINAAPTPEDLCTCGDPRWLHGKRRGCRHIALDGRCECPSFEVDAETNYRWTTDRDGGLVAVIEIVRNGWTVDPDQPRR